MGSWKGPGGKQDARKEGAHGGGGGSWGPGMPRALGQSQYRSRKLKASPAQTAPWPEHRLESSAGAQEPASFRAMPFTFRR